MFALLGAESKSPREALTQAFFFNGKNYLKEKSHKQNSVFSIKMTMIKTEVHPSQLKYNSKIQYKIY